MAGVQRTVWKRCMWWRQNRLLRWKHHPTVIPSMSKVTLYDYRKSENNTEIKKSVKERLKSGLKELKPELSKFKEEVLTKFRCDGFYDLQHLDYEYLEKFDCPASVEKWVVTADSDHMGGRSTASFILNKNNRGLFSGYVSNEVPKDGITKNAGYCHLRCPRNTMSFKRDLPYDWDRYNELVIRVRGDGRPYLLTIGMDGYFDVNSYDQYNFTLYTRGGPYWQTSKIPFSKFYLSFKGRIQDKQERIELHRVSYFGLTQGDGNDGPFNLEIDYIGLRFDDNSVEDFAYESYEVTPYTV